MISEKRNLKLVAAEGILANLLLGTLFVWSVLRNPLLRLFPDWTDGMLSVIFGIHNLFTCAGILLGGSLCSKLSARKVFLLFALLVFTGLSGFALLPEDRPVLSYVMAFVLFCAFAATGIGLGISVVQSTTIPWFPKNSGAISGALYMALGVSSVFLAAMAQRLLPVLGVRALMPAFGAIVLITALIILCDKRSITAPPAPKGAGGEETGLSRGEMIRSREFWLLVIWNVSLRTAGLILLDHAASIAAQFNGLVITAMLISPANGLGCISVGTALDRLGLGRVMRADAVLMLSAGALLCLGVSSGAYALILAGLLLGGFSYGGSSSSYAAGIKNTFGPKYYSQNFAFSNIAMGCAALLEATSGTVYDRSGSYLPVMLMVAGLAAIALLVALAPRKAQLGSHAD